MQSALGAQASTRTCTKQVPKIFSGVGLDLPASKRTHAHSEELVPQEGARPACAHTPKLVGSRFTENPQSPCPHHPNSSFGYSRRKLQQPGQVPAHLCTRDKAKSLNAEVSAAQNVHFSLDLSCLTLTSLQQWRKAASSWEVT